MSEIERAVARRRAKMEERRARNRRASMALSAGAASNLVGLAALGEGTARIQPWLTSGEMPRSQSFLRVRKAMGVRPESAAFRRVPKGFKNAVYLPKKSARALHRSLNTAVLQPMKQRPLSGRRGVVLAHSPRSFAAVHELGHAKYNQGRLGRAVGATGTAGRALRSASPALGLAGIGASALADPDSTVSKAAPWLAGAAAVPLLAEEAGASINGLRGLRKAGASRATQARYLARMGPAYASYLGAAAIPVGAALIARRVRRGKTDESQWEPAGALGAGLGGGAAVGRAVGEVQARRGLGRELNRVRAMHNPSRSYRPAIPLLGRPAQVVPPDPPLEQVLKRARARHRAGMGRVMRARGAFVGGAAGGLAGAAAMGGLILHRAVRRGKAKNPGTEMGGFSVGRRNVSHDASAFEGNSLRISNEYGTAHVPVPPWVSQAAAGSATGSVLGGAAGIGLGRAYGHGRAAMRPKWSPEIARRAGRLHGARFGRTGAVLGGVAGLSAALSRSLSRRPRRPRRENPYATDDALPKATSAGIAAGLIGVHAIGSVAKTLREKRKVGQPPEGGAGQQAPQQVTLDPETLKRLRNLHGFTGSTELRKYGQAISGVF